MRWGWGWGGFSVHFSVSDYVIPLPLSAKLYTCSAVHCEGGDTALSQGFYPAAQSPRSFYCPDVMIIVLKNDIVNSEHSTVRYINVWLEFDDLCMERKRIDIHWRLITESYNYNMCKV